MHRYPGSPNENGSRPRPVAAQPGDIELRMPKLRRIVGQAGLRDACALSRCLVRRSHAPVLTSSSGRGVSVAERKSADPDAAAGDADEGTGLELSGGLAD